MATSAIEAELVEASGFEPTKNYERQDYLAALARAINEIDEDDFDGLTVESQDWFNSAVKALNKKKELPDFPDLQADEDEAEGEDEGEAETDESEEDAPSSDDDEGDDDESEGDPTDDNPEDDGEEDTTEIEVEAPKPKKKAAKPEKSKFSKDKPRRVGKLPKPGTGDVNRYGLKAGSQGDKATAMFEAGSRMGAVTEEVGGTYYNLLKKLTKEGHKVEKSPNGIIKLTHRDGASPAKKPKGKK